ncbi:MAG: hypothetical protein IKJ18_01480 [Bacteroidaceae bacterium]|nr:hypothetical protein [Bacteroidaceae bacterium]
MKLKQLACVLLLSFGLTTNAANTITKVTQVSTEVTLSTDVDYIITGTTPFTGSGKVNITNTEHAVLIIQNIRPSAVISNHLRSRVFINGAQAVNGQNCQVKMYAHGAIIMPYSKDFKPLTVYSEPNFGGTAVNDFGLEHSGGFMNTLTEEKLNNQIRSFKLKRGYMVTFATGKGGWGYSRCFIADKEDLEFAELPTHLDARISSYRVFQWYDAEKKGLASDTRESANSLLGTSWCYDWAAGFSHLPDRECIPHQIYVAWPSASACGSATYACHMKTNNEPGNSADDRPQDVETILDQWQELMRTGLRLCSESSHDGSWAHLDEFIAEVDRRGWRCDILDLHCYWSVGFDKGNMENYYNRYGKRPIWISEFVWGASWNNNGIFATDRTFSEANQQKNLDAMKGIFASLNESPHVERYAYWNSEADCSKLLRGESELSLTGKYFQTMQSGMAYRKEYEKIPNVVYSAPTNVTGDWADQRAGIYKLSWEDTNGDMLNEIQIQRMSDDEEGFVTIKSIMPSDQNGKKITYTFQDTLTSAGIYEYRVINVTAENRMLVSPSFKASRSSILSSSIIHYGEIIMVGLDEIKIGYNESFEENPAIFMGTATINNSNLNLTNLVTLATENGFTYTPNPWISSASEKMAEPEMIPFMSIPEGNHQFGQLACEVGTAKVRMSKEQEITFTTPFPEGVVPIVLTEIYKPSIIKAPMVTKVRDITNTGFKCQIMVEEGAETSSSSYNVKYMAITPGIGVADEEQGLIIAAGCNKNAMYGTANRATYFMVGADTLYMTSPYIFTQLQTKNYDAATIIRRQSRSLTAEKNGVKYTVGARLKRVTDPNRKTASDGTKLNATSMKDDLGWVVLYISDENTSDPANIDMEKADQIALSPYVVNNVIYVDGHSKFEVYNTLGVKLNPNQPQLSGVYIVRTTNATAMVVVK